LDRVEPILVALPSQHFQKNSVFHGDFWSKSYFRAKIKEMRTVLLFLLLIPFVSQGQEDTLVYNKAKYEPQEFYKVKDYTKRKPNDEVRNVIFMIGDGMGTSQVYAGLLGNRGELYIETMPFSGFSTTYSADNLITDSAAGATAFSIGEKTNNGAIGVDRNNVPKKTILEMAIEQGMGTGLVASCGITHATPASFIAHQPNRNMYEEIAADFLKVDIDIFIGGARNHFTKRKDGRNLLTEFKAKNYEVINTMDSLKYAKGHKVAALISEEHLPPSVLGRGEMLRDATEFTIDKLKENDEGFFLMIEGSQIDWGGHDNNVPYIVTEMLDFDKTVGEVLRFASLDKHTLVVITADHETGGFSINGGDINTGVVEGKFTTGGHTGVMVPVYAYGPKAEEFSGIMDNTEFFYKFRDLMGLK
jgi:alkaline phosphatase